MLDGMELFLARPGDLPPIAATISLVWAFIFGACWGSFANVVIARVPAGISVVTPRSRCPKCEKQISGFDNIPVLSWVILRGKCRNCKTTISWRYPLIELICGVAGMAVVARAGWTLDSLELFTLVVILTAIAFIDIDTWTVPHPMWIALVAAGLALGGGRAYLAGDPWVLFDRLIGAAGAGVALGAVVVVSTGILRRTGRLAADQTAMGWGDPLILVGVGAFLGWKLLPLVLFLASLQGAVIGLIARATGGLAGTTPVSDDDDWIPPKGAVPFGPFLALGALEAAFFGDAVLDRVLPMLGLGI